MAKKDFMMNFRNVAYCDSLTYIDFKDFLNLVSKANKYDFEVYFENIKAYPDGHEICFSVPVHGSPDVETKTLVLDFSTTCRAPSTWIVRFFYKRVPETGKINCSVSLSRTDDGKHAMHAFSLVTFYDVQGQVARFTQVVCSGPVNSGGTIQGGIRDEDNSEIINQRLLVRICVHIYKCHGKP
ncbi:hypothetical protein HNY73_010500 [Argiope bruennichi]|uniref:Uncharacterized protein n=1 Tax=Argiope bruennichi TaxID=94029 RepID=A0A8T0F3Q9_ARGBR|nr:hypothetical protein HNY73_010500 [Argiope bruennichi]